MQDEIEMMLPGKPVQKSITDWIKINGLKKAKTCPLICLLAQFAAAC